MNERNPSSDYSRAEYDEFEDEITDVQVFAEPEEPTEPGGPRAIAANVAVDMSTTADQLRSMADDFSGMADRIVELVRDGGGVPPGIVASAFGLIAGMYAELERRLPEGRAKARHLQALFMDAATIERKRK